MSSTVRISGRIIAAARALVGVSEADFAAACDLSVETLNRLEAGGSALAGPEDVGPLRRGLDHFGVTVVPETADLGAGVRLKFTREDVRQIGRFETEGGMVGSDDAP